MSASGPSPPADRSAERLRAAKLARHYRDAEDLSIAEIARRLGRAEATVKQAGLARSAKVFSTGISAIDSDSATALVAGSITQSYPKTPGADQRVETEPAPFRVQVTLVKIKGTWLVDDFQPLTGTDDSGSGTPSGAPSVVPSEGVSP